MNKKKSKNNRKRNSYIALALVVFILIACTMVLRNENYSNNEIETADTQSDVTPTTEQERKDSEAYKDKLSSNDTVEPTTDNLRVVVPIITSSQKVENQYVIGAFVPMIYESDGICVLNAKLSDLTFTKQVNAQKDATTTRCENFIIDRGEFPDGGIWNITIDYQSISAKGTSQPTTLEVK